MTRPLDPEARALLWILRRLSCELRDATKPPTICPIDGCLLLKEEQCPACQVRARRVCDCGTRIRKPDADRCKACRRKVPRTRCAGCRKWVRTPGEDLCHACRSLAAPKPKCACGRQIRAAGQTVCSPCRTGRTGRTGRPPRNTIPEETDRCPVAWVRKGAILRPVYEQSEVA